MSATYLGEIELTDETLAHYGVLGMKWGHRKGQVTSSAAYNRISTMTEDEYQKLLKGVKLVSGKGKSSSSSGSSASKSKSGSGSSSSSSGSSSKSSGSSSNSGSSSSKSSSTSSSSNTKAKKAVDDLLTRATGGNSNSTSSNESNKSNEDDYKIQVNKEWSDLLDDYITRKNNRSQLDNVTFRKKATKLKKRS